MRPRACARRCVRTCWRASGCASPAVQWRRRSSRDDRVHARVLFHAKRRTDRDHAHGSVRLSLACSSRCSSRSCTGLSVNSSQLCEMHALDAVETGPVDTRRTALYALVRTRAQTLGRSSERTCSNTQFRHELALRCVLRAFSHHCRLLGNCTLHVETKSAAL